MYIEFVLVFATEMFLNVTSLSVVSDAFEI